MDKDNCKELLNIKYKNMLLNPNNNIFNNDNSETKKTLDDFLEINKESIKVKTWSQLNKMEKMNKLFNYIDSVIDEYELTTKEVDELKQYIRQCLNRKQLQRMKDVQYDKKDGTVKKINGLHIKKGKLEEKEKRFTLKNVDKKDSTLKNLGGGRSKKNKLITKIRKSKKGMDSSDKN